MAYSHRRLSVMSSRNAVVLLLMLPLLLSHVGAQPAPVVISGQVSDATNGQPLQGVVIADNCGIATTTATDSAGNYQIAIPGPDVLGNTSPILALTYSKPGYRFVYRPSIENQPFDTGPAYGASTTVNVAMSPYKPGAVADVLLRAVVKTSGVGELGSISVSPGAFRQGDSLFIDVAAADCGDDPALTVSLRGASLTTVDLMTGVSRAGHGGHFQFFGEFSNPSGTATVTGPWHFSFSHFTAWPGLSTSVDNQLTAATGQANWIVGPFTIALQDHSVGSMSVLWQVVRLSNELAPAIDIKPGSFPNSVNPKSRGTIPVAILSTPTFSAPAVVNRGSLTFGRTGDEASLAFCNARGEDVNSDLRLDLVCHFNTQGTAFQPGDVQGVLKGRTVGEIPIRGMDSVKVVP